MTETMTTKAPCATSAQFPWGPLRITERLSLPELGQAQFAETVFRHGLRHTAAAQWTTTSKSLDAVLPHAQSTVRAHRMQSALLDLAPLHGELAFALVTLRRGTAHVDIAAENPERTDEVERWLRATFPAPEATERPEIAVRFWSCSPHGAGCSSRTIAVPPLGEIEANYPTGVRDRLARLAGPEFRPGDGGQLILWYGPPGTGKTYALRALGWEWREWCELHYVIDPEMFFGQRADYMIDVLLDEDEPLLNRGPGAEPMPSTPRDRGSRAYSTSSTAWSDKASASSYSSPPTSCSAASIPQWPGRDGARRASSSSRSTRPRLPPGSPRAGFAVRVAAHSPSRTCSHTFTVTRWNRSVPSGSGLEAWAHKAQTHIRSCSRRSKSRSRVSTSCARPSTEPRRMAFTAEGFWHCRYFIGMMARYGRELDAAPDVLPYGWAAVLYLYDLR